MNDVIEIAKTRRNELLAEIETRMAEVEELENFIRYGRGLIKKNGTAPKARPASSEVEAAHIAAE